MRRRRRERPDAQLGRWVCDGLVPMPLPTRLAREVARAADFDALHAALARIEHAFIECRIDHDQVAALRQQHRRRFYALADEAIVVRHKREDPLSRASVHTALCDLPRSGHAGEESDWMNNPSRSGYAVPPEKSTQKIALDSSTRHRPPCRNRPSPGRTGYKT